MKYIRMPIEKESPEQLGYDRIKHNLTESSVPDRRLKDLGLDLDELVLSYGDHLGIPALRRIIAQSGKDLTESQVMVTSGASLALFIVATSLLENGDHLVILSPNYATNIVTPRIIGCDISYSELVFENKFKLDLNELESQIRPETKFVSLTYPHNPTGATITKSQLLDIIRIVESKQCLLLFDETYRDMTFSEILPVAASLSPKVISVSSLSKTYGIPGVRIGWLICQDPDLMHQFLCAKEQISICSSIIDEAVGQAVLSQRRDWIHRNQTRILRAFHVVKDWITHEEHLEWIEPQGGCVCFPRIKPEVRLDLDEFYTCLNNIHGTYVGPGHWFERDRRFFRIGYAWPELKDLEMGLQAISQAIRDVKFKGNG